MIWAICAVAMLLNLAIAVGGVMLICNYKALIIQRTEGVIEDGERERAV